MDEAQTEQTAFILCPQIHLCMPQVTEAMTEYVPPNKQSVNKHCFCQRMYALQQWQEKKKNDWLKSGQQKMCMEDYNTKR